MNKHLAGMIAVGSLLSSCTEPLTPEELAKIEEENKALATKVVDRANFILTARNEAGMDSPNNLIYKVNENVLVSLAVGVDGKYAASHVYNSGRLVGSDIDGDGGIDVSAYGSSGVSTKGLLGLLTRAEVVPLPTAPVPSVTTPN